MENALPAQKGGQERTAEESPKHNPELLSKWLVEGNALVAAGKDLSSMSVEAQKAVEIQPAEIPVHSTVAAGGKAVMERNPYAGTVGLSCSVLQHVTGVINAAERVVANPKTPQGDIKDAQARLVAYKDVLAETRASVGITVEASTAKTKKGHEGVAVIPRHS